MSVVEKDVIDGIGYIQEEKALSLMISDHLDWKKEYDHLIKLQDKINTYLGFIENGEYKEEYPEYDIVKAIIEIYFVYEPTKNAIYFLNSVQEQIGKMGVLIKCILDTID